MKLSNIPLSKIIVVTIGSDRDKIIRSGSEPIWYVDSRGYTVSRWEEGSEIEIIQVETLCENLIAYEYVVI